MTSRRDVLAKLFKGVAMAGTGGLLWHGMAEAKANHQMALRPPGAIDEADFLKACTKCGQCSNACPYNTIEMASATDLAFIGTPYIVPRKVPCYLCTDYPCTKACPTNALNTQRLSKDGAEPNIDNSRIGLAVIHKEACIAYHGIQCDACYRACPLMGKAITIESVKNTDTGRHANLQPVVNSDFCTGCGLCEHACITEKAAIFVLPLALSTGNIGEHYLLIGTQGISKPKNEVQPAMDNDTQSALDYLNSDSLSDE